MFTFFAADLCLTATISQCFHLGSPFELFTGYFSKDKFTKSKFRDLGDFHSSAKQTSCTNVRMSERIKQSPTVDIWNSAEEVKHRLVYKTDRSSNDVGFGQLAISGLNATKNNCGKC